jgi:hypothetical protein
MQPCPLRNWASSFIVGPGGAARTGAPSEIQIALPQLSDALGRTQPIYYSSIQTADIDGDGQSEVTVHLLISLKRRPALIARLFFTVIASELTAFFTVIPSSPARTVY